MSFYALPPLSKNRIWLTAGKMAQWVKMFSGKPDNPGQEKERKEKADPCQLSSDLQTHCGT